MSILVLGSSSRIAQGLIRQFLKSGRYEKIVCADPYSSYWGIQRHHQFLDTLKDEKQRSRLEDIQITEKTDLVEAISRSSEVVYVTHQYFQNAPTKQNLLLQTAKVTQQTKSVKKFIAVTPVELDNYNEQFLSVAEDSEKAALEANDKTILVKSDLTFGQDSFLVNNIISRLFNKQSLYFKPTGGGPAPINTGELAAGIDKLLQGTQTGLRLLAQGPQRIDWNSFINILQNASLRSQGESFLEKVVSPTNLNLISDLLYERDYVQLAQFINKYHPPNSIGVQDFAAVTGIQLTDIESFYKTSRYTELDFNSNAGSVERIIQNKLY